MKSGLDKKTLICATLACIIISIVDILLDRAAGFRWFSPKEFMSIVAWLVIGIAWIVYFLEHRKSK